MPLLQGLRLLLLRLAGFLDLRLHHSGKEQPPTPEVGPQDLRVAMSHLVDPQPPWVSPEWFPEHLGLPKDMSSLMLPVLLTSQIGGIGALKYPVLDRFIGILSLQFLI